MDTMTARMLSDLTTSFYQQVGSSFSATRHAPWDGWQRVVDLARPRGAERLRVLDLACGNLRFERYLADRGIPFVAHAVDNCDELAGFGLDGLMPATGTRQVEYHHADLIGMLFDVRAAGEVPWPLDNDLCVSFGFMHHVALPEHRRQVMRWLAAAVRPGGIVAVTFWQFAHSERLMAKARPVDGGDAGDYLLGWQQRQDVWRYCHSYTDNEIDELVDACGDGVCELLRFSSDGRTNDLNRYLILQRM